MKQYPESFAFLILRYLELFTREFSNQICPKSFFLVSNRKSEHHQWILHIQTSLGTKFQL